MILLDLDNFKDINDKHGHLKGDEVLVEVATILGAMTRKTDIAGRWGGEEFLVVCPSTQKDGAARLAESLRLAIEAQDKEIVFTTSIGVATIKNGESIRQLFHRVDQALYQAKVQGKNCVIVAD
jgi:diguanylate cyclase (GGDEF)-like protein